MGPYARGTPRATAQHAHALRLFIKATFAGSLEGYLYTSLTVDNIYKSPQYGPTRGTYVLVVVPNLRSSSK